MLRVCSLRERMLMGLVERMALTPRGNGGAAWLA